MSGAMFNPDNYDEFPQYTAGGRLRDDDGSEWAYCKAATAISPEVAPAVRVSVPAAPS